MKAKVCYQPTLAESLDSYIEYAEKTKRFADVGFYEKLKAQLEKYQAEVAELPAEFNYEPAADYDNLRKQFLALQRIANSLSAQNSYLRSLDKSDIRAAISVNAKNVSAERDTNAKLTDLLERAEAENDKLRLDVERYQFLRNGASGDLGFDDVCETLGYVDLVFCCEQEGSLTGCTGDDLDRVIDAEIARLKAAKAGDA